MNDVVRQKEVYWNIDFQNTGLGGGSCGPDVLSPYRLKAGDISYTFRLKAININKDNLSDMIVKSPYAAAPVIQPSSPVLNGKVEITSNESGTEIRYTTDGTEPTQSSALYTAPLEFGKPVVVKAKSFKKDLIASEVVSQQYEAYAIPLFTLTEIRAMQQPAIVDVKLQGISRLGLIVTDPDNNESYDHTDFPEARFIKADGTEIFLSSLKPISSKQGWGILKSDVSVDDKPITIAGKKYDKGLGTHGAAEIWYDVPEGVTGFKTLFGIDDETNGQGIGKVGLIVLGGKK